MPNRLPASPAMESAPASRAHGVQALHAVDWSFSERSGTDVLGRIHPYPAKFIPEIPGTLLDCLPPPPGSRVLDPFMGSGTTLVEAQRRGYGSVGVDLNPIAALITRVRTSSLVDSFLDIAAQTSARAESMGRAPIPQIPRLEHWFKPSVQEAVAQLRAAIRLAPMDAQPALELALSSILVRVSNQESDTRYAAIDKPINKAGVFAAFALACRRLADALATRKYDLDNTQIIRSDVLQVAPIDIQGPIGAVITSPPYPNAYEYWLYHKYRMWWLGHDPLAVKAAEIGARAHFFKKKHHTADDFVRQMERCFDLLSAVLVKDGYICFVVGRSVIHGQTIDNAGIITRAAAGRGFQPIFTVERQIAATKKSFNLSHANIKTEHVLVFAR